MNSDNQLERVLMATISKYGYRLDMDPLVIHYVLDEIPTRTKVEKRNGKIVANIEVKSRFGFQVLLDLNGLRYRGGRGDPLVEKFCESVINFCYPEDLDGIAKLSLFSNLESQIFGISKQLSELSI